MHAEARAAAVGHLLRTVPGSLAVHHDLSRAAEGGPVRRVLGDAVGEVESAVLPPVEDCGCCALREDLPGLLRSLSAAGRYGLAVVELWESVEPRGIAELIAGRCGEAVRLSGVVTAVDPALVLPCLANGDDLAAAGLAVAPGDHRVVADTFARQLEYPPVLAVAEGGEPAGPEDLALLWQLHPTARQVTADSAALTGLAFAGFDPEAAAAAQHPACARLPQPAEEAGVATLVWRAGRPFHPERLHRALEEIACAAVRSRGRFWLADRPDVLLSWDAAGGALCVESAGPWLAALPEGAWDLVPPERRIAAALDWDPVHGDRGQHLVFTGPGLDRGGLAALLDSCLLTPEEHAAGPDAWRRLPAVFDTWLDPATRS
ncbi:GTP-binding protein [Streptomyces sp. YIM 98790]|uniref:GTP-binding protein n=1 Tax=Streptomyces sp. YIM 98790 TaxID=2689077 RepID=UPI001A9FE73E